MERRATKIAILGAGRGGTALLELLHQIPDVDIVGIADRDPDAPGLKRAREWKIPVTHRPLDLIRTRSATLIVDVTGDPSMQQTILTHKEPRARARREKNDPRQRARPSDSTRR